MKEVVTFSFGKNWTKFLKYINEERIKDAKASLKELLNAENFENKSFLDIGCGSGLFSYSAFKLNAQRIVSFDFDPLSVRCCRHFYQKVSREGCSSGIFNPVKLFSSVSISGPSTTEKPILVKIEHISFIT